MFSVKKNVFNGFGVQTKKVQPSFGLFHKPLALHVAIVGKGDGRNQVGVFKLEWSHHFPLLQCNGKKFRGLISKQCMIGIKSKISAVWAIRTGPWIRLI
jgi:hypothetical protein